MLVSVCKCHQCCLGTDHDSAANDQLPHQQEKYIDIGGDYVEEGTVPHCY
jgi:hypothetical protein